MTVQEIIDAAIGKVGAGILEGTVDTLKAGDPAAEVKGIVTTFITTPKVVEEAKKLGANLIITHEPTFYDHRDQITWQKGTPAYEFKRRLIEDSGIAIWRFHDYWHSCRPDGILTGVVRTLGWESFADVKDEMGLSYVLPETTLLSLAKELKEKLGGGAVRIVGDPGLKARKIAFLMGACPMEYYQEVLTKVDFDVLVCGETSEWMICEYMRDTVQAGVGKGLVLLGHRNSEEEGMRYLTEWIRPLVGAIPVTFVQAGDPIVNV